MNNHHEEEKENGERWLLTYSDLITLLLALFVVLYSMANVDAEKFKKLMEALGSQFGAGGNAGAGQSSGLSLESGAGGAIISFPPLNSDSLGVSLQPTGTPPGSGNALEIEKMEQVKGEVEDMLNLAHLGNEVKVSMTERGLVISINAEVLFETGKATLRPNYVETVRKIGSVLEQISKNQIVVEGHTDKVPINTYEFPSNWYLSSARAIQVRDLLMQHHKLAADKVSVQAYGDSHPIASNDTPEGRAKNRRVNVVILKDAYTSGIDVSTAPPSDSQTTGASLSTPATQTPAAASSAQH